MAKHSRVKNNQVKDRLANLEKLAFNEMDFVKTEMDKQKVLLKEIAQLRKQAKKLSRINSKALSLIQVHAVEYKKLLRRHTRFLTNYNKMRSAVNKDNTNNA